MMSCSGTNSIGHVIYLLVGSSIFLSPSLSVVCTLLLVRLWSKTLLVQFKMNSLKSLILKMWII